ncbi:MAG: J domain-containing protein [Desulfobulbales bacterium]
MYLAEHIINGRKKYVIRISDYDPKTNFWQSRDLMDLGRRPWEYIEYPGGNAFYIKESVCDRLNDQGVEFDLCELEELFWSFIRKEVRQKIETFYCRSTAKSRRTVKEKNQAPEQVQTFDKRRLYYLRCGSVPRKGINNVPLRYFKPLLNKSRDEIEQYILQLEKSLYPREYKQYVYMIFDLQRYFRSSPARSIPQALDQDELDRYFIKDICRLHGDQLFWSGLERGEMLHEYLVRYVVMFFDYEFDGGSAWHEYLQNFINSKRFYRPPTPKPTITVTETVEIFGISAEKLNIMDKSGLTKLFRQRAHELHPDKGGDHEAFVRLAEAYKQLLREKS